MHVSTANMNFRNYFSACFLLFQGRHKILVRLFLKFPTSCHIIVIFIHPWGSRSTAVQSWFEVFYDMVCAQGRGCSQYGLHYLSSCSISRSHETRAISPRQICLQLRAGGGGKYGHRGTIRRSRATILAILLIETNDADIGRRLSMHYIKE